MKKSGAGAKKALVIEDEPVISQICQRILAGEGFKVSLAADGVEAEDKLQEKDYDLILIDMRTPLISGKQLYQYLYEKYPELVNRVIFTTGDVMDKGIQAFLERSGRPFLTKPFTPDELKTAVRENLRQMKA
jgi:DNA-binding response OmpR family regulator